MVTSTTTTKPASFEVMAYALDDQTDLARPALLIAADEYPDIDIEGCLVALDDLADAALDAAITDADSEYCASLRLAQFLCDQCGFRGDTDNYYDPANSYFNRVVERRVGIPITLSLVMVEVGQRLGLPLVGIGLPAHFLVGCSSPFDTDDLPKLIDPFSGGIAVSIDDCRKHCSELGVALDPERHLQPISNRQFLIRMLANLRAIYTRQGDVARTMRTIGRMASLDRDQAEGYRDLSSLLVEHGRHREAQRCLRAYLECFPSGERSESARKLLTSLLERRARRN